jgi:hypothetical protein
MQLFVRDPLTMIAAPVQGDVDGIPKGSHDLGVSHEISIPLLLAVALYAVSVGLLGHGSVHRRPRQRLRRPSRHRQGMALGSAAGVVPMMLVRRLRRG